MVKLFACAEDFGHSTFKKISVYGLIRVTKSISGLFRESNATTVLC